MGDRKSEAEIPPLIEDPIELAQMEAKNALAQFDWAMEEVERWIASDSPKLKVSTLLNLHRVAMQGIDQYAGNFRPASVAIRGSGHVPVSGEDVPRYIEEMLDYLEENWSNRTAIHLSSYAMWRLNWIHPFADGNGRTSRMLSYMILCGRLKLVFPGTNTIPEQISENKRPYYDALEAADENFKKGRTDVGSMEALLEGYLAKQLVNIHDDATGNGVEDAVKPIAATPPATSNKKSWSDRVESKPVIVGGLIAIGVTVLTIIFG